MAKHANLLQAVSVPQRLSARSPDAAGNFSSVSNDGTAVGRTTNAQNETTAVGSASLSYDANGNTTADDQGHTLIYDAWNRLVAVKSGSTTIAATRSDW